MVNIVIDGKKIKARDGAMVIEAADDAGIYIPRFCYHKKLSIAANCRMCLIEVEKAAKPLPACATPVTDGMKIFTKSPKAIDAQKGVMEFLLINHPLDCPICDQGGECELQDIAMGYGNDISKFAEKKRVVQDKNLGPLIATDMTRCIHCTRCVRFGSEIAGIRELGATGRGEHMEIGTYITRNVTSEMSGNVIDLCPVGALTSKPFRFSARAWELVERESIAPHDCLGSNLGIHVRNGREVVRVVPRENETINETWISDRDRFSYEALNGQDRLVNPMVKIDGEWQETDWESALNAVVAGVNNAIAESGANKVGAIASAVSTTEELYLLQKLMRQLRVHNIDHRVRLTDFSDQETAPVFPWLGQPIQELENNNAVFLVGSNIRKDQPIAAHRLRKSSVNNGTAVMQLNSVLYDLYMPLAQSIIVAPHRYVGELIAVAKALIDFTKGKAPEGFDSLAKNVEVNEAHRTIAEKLAQGKVSSILLGPQAINHPEASIIRMLVSLLASLSDSRFGYLSDAGNAAGAYLAGMLPHRLPGGNPADEKGLNANKMLRDGLDAYVLLQVEPEVEAACAGKALASLNNAKFVVTMSSFVSDDMKQYANVLLPVSPFTETSGTFVNSEGTWQGFSGVVPPKGETRPAWKVLRVLGNLFGLDGFEYISSEEVQKEVQDKCANLSPDNTVLWRAVKIDAADKNSVVRIAETQMYAGDAMQRRAVSLQSTFDADVAAIRVNHALAEKIGLKEGVNAVASQNGTDLTLPVILDDTVADNGVLIHAGLKESAALDVSLMPVTIKPL